MKTRRKRLNVEQKQIIEHRTNNSTSIFNTPNKSFSCSTSLLFPAAGCAGAAAAAGGGGAAAVAAPPVLVFGFTPRFGND